MSDEEEHSESEFYYPGQFRISEQQRFDRNK